jgi:hypothetical protein
MNKSKKQEERIAKETGGKKQPASGSQWHSKGDVKGPLTKGLIADGFLIEGKTTAKKQITLRRALLEDHFNKGIESNRIGILQICLDDNTRSPLCFAIMPWDLANELMKAYYEEVL